MSTTRRRIETREQWRQQPEWPRREPETEFEIMNAQLRIARWSSRKIQELEEKLQKLYDDEKKYHGEVG